VLKNRGTLSSLSSRADRPFGTLFIDHAGPFQFGYVLIIVCGFTHFSFAEPVRGLDAITTARALFNVCTFVGCPATVHSDRGSSFDSAVFRELLNLLGAVQSFSPVAFPRANGLAERTVKDLKKSLSTMIESIPGDVAVRLFAFHHNSSPHSKCGISPFETVFGFSSNICNLNLDYYSSETPIAEQQRLAREVFRIRQSDSLTEMITRYRLQSRDLSSYKPGDPVIKVTKKELAKPLVEGPFTLLGRAGENGNTWRAVYEGKMYLLPESVIKLYDYDSNLFELFPELRPPNYVNKPIDSLTKGDLFVARNESSTNSARLYQVITNSTEKNKIKGRLMKPNNLSEFVISNEDYDLDYDRVFLSGFRLRNGRLPDTVRREVQTILSVGVVL
jgi:transposase InsO family protein